MISKYDGFHKIFAQWLAFWPNLPAFSKPFNWMIAQIKTGPNICSPVVSWWLIPVMMQLINWMFVADDRHVPSQCFWLFSCLGTHLFIHKFHHKIPRINNSNDHRYQWKDSQQLGCVASAWCLVELSLWHVLRVTTWRYRPLTWWNSFERKLGPNQQKQWENVDFCWFLMKSELSTVYLWDFVGFCAGIAGAKKKTTWDPSQSGIFACQSESVSFQDFLSVPKWNLPRYFGKRGWTLKHLPTLWCCVSCSPGLSLSKHR